MLSNGYMYTCIHLRSHAGITTSILFGILWLQYYALEPELVLATMAHSSFNSTHISRKAQGFRPGDYTPGDATAEFAQYDQHIGILSSSHKTSPEMEGFLSAHLSMEPSGPQYDHANPVFVQSPGLSYNTPRSGYSSPAQQTLPSSP